MFAIAPATTGTNFRALDTVALNTIAELTALGGMRNGQQAFVSGYHEAGDGGGGPFYWDSSSTDTENGVTILEADSGGTGRWRLIHNGIVSVLQSGAKGDGVADDAAEIQAALDSGVRKIIFPVPSAHWRTTATITVPENIELEFLGDNGFSTEENWIQPTSAVSTGLSIPLRKGVKLTNVGVRMADMNNGSVGIDVDQSWWVKLDGVFVSGVLGANSVGLQLRGGATTGCFWCRLNGVWVSGGSGTGIKYLGTASERITSTIATNCYVTGVTTGYNLALTGSGIRFFECGAESCSGSGATISETGADLGSVVLWDGGEFSGNGGWGITGTSSGRVRVHEVVFISNSSGEVDHATLGFSIRDTDTFRRSRGQGYDLRDIGIGAGEYFGSYAWSDPNAGAYARFRAKANSVSGGAQDGHVELLRLFGGTERVQVEWQYVARLIHRKSIANAVTTVLTIPIATNGAVRVKTTARGVETAAGSFVIVRETACVNNGGTLAKADQTAFSAGAGTPVITYTISGTDLLVRFNHASATSTDIDFTFEVDGDITNYTKG